MNDTATTPSTPTPPTAILFLADGAEEIEAVTILDVLRRGSVRVLGMSVTPTLRIQGSRNVAFLADTLWDDTLVSAAAALILPGGLKGMETLRADTRVLAALCAAHAAGKWVAAICAAPLVLLRAGLLEGKDATCHPDVQSQLVGANIQSGKDVVVDGNVITSRGPATSMAFAVELVRALSGDATARRVAEKLF